MLCKLKKVKSVEELYHWGTAIARDGARRRKMLISVEYVLQKLKVVIDQSSSAFGMGTRGSPVRTKQDSDFLTIKPSRTWSVNLKGCTPFQGVRQVTVVPQSTVERVASYVDATFSRILLFTDYNL